MKKEAKIGAFAIAMIITLWAGIRFMSGYDILSRNVDYYVVYDQSGGLQKAAMVMIRGVKVGSVTSVELDQAREKVVAKLTVSREYAIPADSKAKIFSPGIMSAQAIDIQIGTSANMLERGDTLFSESEKGLMDMAFDELEFFKSQITTVVEDLNQTMGNINTLMETNANSINSTLSNLSGVTARLNRLMSTQQENIESTLDGVAQMSQTLGDNSERFNSIIANVDSLSYNLSQAELSTTIAELNKTLEALNSGGSAGLLLSDKELYENLTSATASLDTLLSDMQANPKRYVHFSLFGGKKE